MPPACGHCPDAAVPASTTTTAIAGTHTGPLPFKVIGVCTAGAVVFVLDIDRFERV
jgi:hypothetical protein